MLHYLITAFLAIACVWLLIQNVHYESKAKEAILKKDSQERYYEQIWKDNETLRAYMDNQHLCWNTGLFEFFDRVPSDRDLVVLIRGDDLYKLYHDQWADGNTLGVKDAESTIQMLQQALDELSLDRHAPELVSFANPTFDNEFALFINQLTATARRYAGTQQLRARMAHCVVEYRKYLAAKQRGEFIHFPK